MRIPFTSLFVILQMVAGISCLMGLSSPAWAQETPLEAHPVHPLMTAQVLVVKSIALTERGLQDSTAITKTVTDRLTDTGFTIASSPDQPHDAVVRVKCEERQTWTGPSKHRSTSPSPTSRLWKGPACHISYRHGEQSPHWSWEVRTSFEDTSGAAEIAGASDTGTFAMTALNTQLQQDDFPLFLVAEWEQADRLLMLFQKSTDKIDRQKTILKLMGTLSSDKAFEALKEALNNSDLAPTALLALGQQGEKAIPALASYLETATNSDHRLAVIQAFGAIATQSNAPALFTQFMKALDTEEPKIQTEAVKGLGNLGDRRAIQPLEKLNLKTWTNPSSSPDMTALREMLSWSLWQLSPSAHTAE
ncbi:MAG: HEAT repeat domain-containing protein [Nitrospirota bacterium]|nr:HEAT repeat domain-containing protein [Nitrospirota bacterium]